MLTGQVRGCARSDEQARGIFLPMNSRAATNVNFAARLIAYFIGQSLA